MSPYDIRSSTKTTVRSPLTGVVTRIDEAGIWVVPLGGDMRTPIGPCRGTSAVQTGDTCLIVWTQEQPWAYSTRLPGEEPVTIDRLPVADPGETSATEVVRADDPRLADHRLPVGPAGGDLTGTYPDPTVPGLATKQSTTAKGQPNGYAALDGAGKVPAAQLPPYPAVPVTSVAGRTGAVVLGKADVGLGNVDDTADAAKPVSVAAQAALNAKADLVGGVVPTSQIPAIALNTRVPVADQAAMLALSAAQVQPGDVAVRGDGAGTFMLVGTDPSELASWGLLNAPTDKVLSVNGQVGTVVLGKTDIGLGSVDNTTDSAKVVASAAKLTTPRTINGVPFDGTANITITDATKAPLASPALTGTPTAPTPATTDNDTSIATTAYVVARIAQDTASKAPLASPAFTGAPTAPTPAAGDNDTSIATTAFVQAALLNPFSLWRINSHLIATTQWWQLSSFTDPTSGKTRADAVLNTGGNTFVFQRSGLYEIQAQITFPTTSNAGERGFYMTYNTTSSPGAGTDTDWRHWRLDTDQSGGGWPTVNGSRKIPVTAGDVVRFFAYQNTGANQNVGAQQGDQLSFEYLGPY